MLFLLTHPRELERPTNTGQWILEALPEQAERIIWQRKHPNPRLLDALSAGRTALVYPTGEGSSTACATVDHFILLDGTWQEAHKMYRLSPYLRQAPWVALSPDQTSRYTLRRNQRPQGLCTYECALGVVQASGDEVIYRRLAAQTYRLGGDESLV